ncbi:MAG: hypothetical protein HN350_10135 [Phycisphaerales bacterium]|jgi:hypothetical protein|nr:hypothetical protein [Phycisphaerales bacterium]
MDEINAIEKLVERAKQDTPDVRSVADGILSRMHHAPPVRITPLSVLAVASAVAATIALALGTYFWMASPDPLTDLYAPVQVGLLW